MANEHLEKPDSYISISSITIPNVITLIRILLVACFSLSLLVLNDRIIALAILMSIGITDFLDGFLARRLGQVSSLGKLLDPVADRVAILTCVSTLAVRNFMPSPLAAAILFRELLISTAAITMLVKGRQLIDVSLLGKAATFGLYLSLPLFLFGYGKSNLAVSFRTGGEVLATISLAAMVVATFNYAVQIFE